jgi:hypothetical protein
VQVNPYSVLDQEILPVKKQWMSIISVCVLSSIVIVAALLAMPAAAAYAAPAAQGGARLENLLQREQMALTNQQQRLDLSNQAVAAAQTWISRLQEQGKDVTVLQNALAAFQSSLAQAQASFNTAQSTLNAHAGFDGSGKVTDNPQALQTVMQAGKAERQFHLTITQATIDFRQVVRQYLAANK